MKKRIINSGVVKRKIEPDFVAKALGAQKTGIKINVKHGPIALMSINKILTQELKSTGGRPRLTGAMSNRKKVPFFEEDWKKLEEIAKNIKINKGYSVTPAQLASIMIHEKLAKIIEQEL